MAGLKDQLDILTSIDIFQHLPQEVLGVLNLASHRSMVGAGRVICRAGDTAEGGYLILNGTLALGLQRNADQKNSGLHPHLGEGSFFGECALLVPVVWDVMVYSYTSVTLMHIPRKDFLLLLNAHPNSIPPIREIFERKVQDFLIACKSSLALSPS